MNQFVYEDNSYAPVPRAFGLKIHCHEEEVFTEASPSRLPQDRDDRPFSNKEVTALPWAVNKFSGSERPGGTTNLAHRVCAGGSEGGTAGK